MFAPLPVYADDPVERFEIVHEAMKGLKESGQAVGAELLTELADFAPPTVLSQASRLQSSQRAFNVVVTNVPGPQFPLYMLGRKLLRIYPQVPLVRNTALGIAIMSYDGTLNFGLLGDFDALPDLDDLAAALRDAIAELAAAAGVAGASDARRALVRRFLGGLLILALSLAIVIAVVIALQSRDEGNVSKGAGPGEKVAARCPDKPAGVTRDARPLSENQIRQALSLGNVVLRYPGAEAAGGAARAPGRADRAVRRRDRRGRPGGHPRPRRHDGRGAGLGPPPARTQPRRPAAAGVRRGVARRRRAEALLR